MQWDIGKPNPRQIEFFKARARFIAYGGARGGGKSWAVRKKAAGLALSYPGAGILIVRRTFPELRENHILPMTADLAGIARYRDADKILHVPRRQPHRIRLLQQRERRAAIPGAGVRRYFYGRGHAVHGVPVHHADGMPARRQRLPKAVLSDLQPRRRGARLGEAAVHRQAVQKDGAIPKTMCLSPANVYDNHALMEHDPDYVRMLENLPEEQRRAWLDWDSGTFSRASISRNLTAMCMCAGRYGIPAHWRRYVTLDYGMDMLAALWVAVDEQGRAVVYRELYEGRDNGKGENGQGHIISAAARRLLEVNGGDEVQAWLAPPDLWNRRQDTGKSAAELFLENGVPLTKTGNSRVAGWLAVREFLAPGPGGQARGGEAARAQARDRARRFCVQNRVEDEEARGGEAAQTLRLRTSGPALCSETEAEAPQASGPALPRLRIFDTCANLIRTLPALRHDERKPEDAAVTPHELTHAPDALRGFCTYWSTAAHAPEAAVHDILRDDFNMKKPTAGPLGQGGKYRVI